MFAQHHLTWTLKDIHVDSEFCWAVLARTKSRKRIQEHLSFVLFVGQTFVRFVFCWTDLARTKSWKCIQNHLWFVLFVFVLCVFCVLSTNMSNKFVGQNCRQFVLARSVQQIAELSNKHKANINSVQQKVQITNGFECIFVICPRQNCPTKFRIYMDIIQCPCQVMLCEHSNVRTFECSIRGTRMLVL